MTSYDIDALIDELLDAETRREWGEEAGFRLAIELGLIEGDVIELEPGERIAPVADSAELIAKARRAKAEGVSMARLFG